MSCYYSLLQNSAVDLIFNAHKARVIADGGVIPNEVLLKATIANLISIYNINDYSQFISKIPVSLDQNCFGYKLGTGVGQTLGMACAKLYSVNPFADITQSTVANQPLLLAKSVDNYYYGPRVTGNQMQTINSQVTTYNNATDTLRLTAKIFMNSQTTTSFDYLFSCGNAGNFAISNRNASKILRIRGSANSADSSLYTPSATLPHWVRYTMTTTQIFYEWSADGISWTAIGTVARPAQGTYSTTLTVVPTALSTANAMSVYNLKFENITTGKSVEFTPNLYNPIFAEKYWAEPDGTLWSNVQSTGATGLKGIIVNDTKVIGDGINYKMLNPSLVINQPYTSYSLRNRLGTGVFYGLAATSQLSNDGVNSTVNNGVALSIANAGRERALITVIANGASSSIAVNNGTAVTGNSGNTNGTYLSILENAGTYGNFVFNSLYIING